MTLSKSGQNFIKYVIEQINLHCPIDIKKVEYRGVLFDLGRRSVSKSTTKRTPLKFKDRSGLMCLTVACNREYRLEQFREAV